MGGRKRPDAGWSVTLWAIIRLAGCWFHWDDGPDQWLFSQESAAPWPCRDTVCVWQSSGQLERIRTARSGAVRGVGFADQCRQIAVADRMGIVWWNIETVRIWNADLESAIPGSRIQEQSDPH